MKLLSSRRIDFIFQLSISSYYYNESRRNICDIITKFNFTINENQLVNITTFQAWIFVANVISKFISPL